MSKSKESRLAKERQRRTGVTDPCSTSHWRQMAANGRFPQIHFIPRTNQRQMVQSRRLPYQKSGGRRSLSDGWINCGPPPSCSRMSRRVHAGVYLPRATNRLRLQLRHLIIILYSGSRRRLLGSSTRYRSTTSYHSFVSFFYGLKLQSRDAAIRFDAILFNVNKRAYW